MRESCSPLTVSPPVGKSIPWPPAGESVLWRPPKVKPGMQSLFCPLTISALWRTTPAIRKKRRHSRRFQSVPQCGTPKRFSLLCSLFTAPNSRFRALKKINETLLSPASLKGGGRLWGGTFGSLPHLSAAESRPQASACKASRQPL